MPLTVAAVLSSIPQRTVAEESLPAHPARSTVLTRVGLTEGEFGAAAYSQTQTQTPQLDREFIPKYHWNKIWYSMLMCF